MKTLQSLFAHKSWANNELFNVLATVDPVEHAQTVNSATRMLNHIYVVDRIFTDGDAGTMTQEEMLLHVITHGSYHRGNVGQMLKQISVAAPRDLHTKFLHVSEPARRRV